MIQSKELAELYSRAIKRWGVELQMTMMIEEMAELTKAITKLQRSGFSKREDRISFIEEFVDVTIMLEQMETVGTRYMMVDFCELASTKRHEKLTRLRKMLEED